MQGVEIVKYILGTKDYLYLFIPWKEGCWLIIVIIIVEFVSFNYSGGKEGELVDEEQNYFLSREGEETIKW